MKRGRVWQFCVRTPTSTANRFSTVQTTVQYRCIFVLLFGQYLLQLDNKAGYWPSSFYRLIFSHLDRWFIIIWKNNTIFLQDIAGYRKSQEGQDSTMLPLRVPNHSAWFGSSCLLTELAIYNNWPYEHACWQWLCLALVNDFPTFGNSDMHVFSCSWLVARAKLCFNI